MGKLRVRKGPEQLKVIGHIAPQPGLEPGPLTQGSAGTRAGTEPRWAHAIPQPPRDSRAHTAARCCHGSPAPHAAPQPRELRGCSRIPGNGLGLGCAHLPGPGIPSLRLQRPCAPPGPPAKGRPLERSDARGAGEGSGTVGGGGALSGAGGRAGHVVRVAAAAASVCAGRSSAAPSERRRGPGRVRRRGAQGRRGGGRGPGGWAESAEGRGPAAGAARPRRSPRPLSLAAPRPEHLPGGTETKEDSCPKVGQLAGPPAPARRRLRPREARWRCYQGEGCCAVEPTRGDICTGTRTHGGTHPKIYMPGEIHPQERGEIQRPTDTQGGTQMRTESPTLEHTQTRTHMHTTHRYRGHLAPHTTPRS